MGAYSSLKGQYYSIHTALASGGEGTVYNLYGHDDLAAKIYSPVTFKTDQDRKMREKKLRTMLNMQIKINPDGVTRIAWPQDILYDIDGNLAGFTMPKVNADYKLYDIYRGGNGAVRDRIYPNYTWKYSVQFAYHLAWIVDYLHSYNIVIADFNPNNIVIDTTQNTVVLIDCDSFDITYGGEHFPCMVGMPEVLAPELQTTSSVINGSFSRQSDNFSLAIHIFRLLMNNEDPFGGIITTGESMSAIAANQAICNGECPYVRNVPGRSIPPHAPSLGMLPPEIINLFKKTFDYTDITAKQNIPYRSTAKEWCLTLAPYGSPDPNSRLKTCSVNPKHVYPIHNKECPWCKIEFPEPAATPSKAVSSSPIASTPHSSLKGNSVKKTVSTGQSAGQTAASATHSGNSVSSPRSTRRASSRRAMKKAESASKIAVITIVLFILMAIVCGIFYHYNIFGFKETVTSGIEWLTEQLSPSDSAEDNENISSEFIITDSNLSGIVFNEYEIADINFTKEYEGESNSQSS